MRRGWWLSGAIVMLCTSALLARQGVVRTDDGRVIEGDVSEDPTSGLVTINIGSAQVQVDRSDVLAIEYGDDVAKQFAQRLAQLPASDIRSRLELGRWALDKDQYDLARKAANEVLKIDPGNDDAMTLLDTIEAQETLTQHKTDAIPPQVPAEPPANAAPAPVPTRTGIFLSDDQINRIRQFELRPDDAVRVSFDPGVREDYLKLSGDNPEDFAALDAVGQAERIIARGDMNLSAGVKILSDPLSIDDFHRRIQVRIIVGCAASGCHSEGTSTSAGDFYLYREASQTPAMMTNFYILQQYRLKLDTKPSVWGAGPVEWRMIDRIHPARSLLVQYGLPPAMAEVPHPPVAGWRPMFAGQQDPQYTLMLDWIGQTLRPMDPDYGFQFSLPAATEPATDP